MRSTRRPGGLAAPSLEPSWVGPRARGKRARALDGLLGRGGRRALVGVVCLRLGWARKANGGDGDGWRPPVSVGEGWGGGWACGQAGKVPLGLPATRTQCPGARRLCLGQARRRQQSSWPLPACIAWRECSSSGRQWPQGERWVNYRGASAPWPKASSAGRPVRRM